MLSVTVIGGYLGSGKTTLVNHMLRNANGKRLAVLVNEFGALPIDEDLIEAQDDDIIAIAGGCVCCSYGNDLIQALMDLAKLDPAPDHVLLEASGIALPGAIAASLSLLRGYQLDGVVVLVDGETVRGQAADPYIGDTIERQLADADIVLLNKTDLITAQQLAQTEAWLQTMAPSAALIRSQQSAVSNALILQSFEPDPSLLARPGDHAAGQFESQFIATDTPVHPERLAKALSDPSLALVRAKGFVNSETGPHTLQVVGRRWEVTSAPQNATPGIVVITVRGQLDMTRINTAVESARVRVPAQSTT